jgi:hypothetical protein
LWLRQKTRKGRNARLLRQMEEVIIGSTGADIRSSYLEAKSGHSGLQYGYEASIKDGAFSASALRQRVSVEKVLTIVRTLVSA